MIKSITMITVTGSLAFDHIMDFPGKFSDHIMPDKIHQINLSFLVNNLSKQKGGTAGNIAYNLALLKTPVSILGTAGHDFSDYADFLKNAGVDVSTIKIIKEEPTSTAFIITDEKDNQIAAFYPGAMNQVHSLKIESMPTKPDFVVISPTTPQAMRNFVQESQTLNIPYMFDPGLALPRLISEELGIGINSATILIGNDYEISLLKQKVSLDDQTLLNQVKILITTLGEKGSLIQSGSETIRVNAAKPTEVIDPTGAGDAYRAGFLTGFIKRLPLKTCGQMGSLAACYAIEKYGTTAHKFLLEEFCERYKKNFGGTLSLSS